MATMTKLTLGAALDAVSTRVTLSALTGVYVYDPIAGTSNTLLYVDRELMEVKRILSTTSYIVEVQRAVGGKVSAHVNGAVVFVGSPSQFLRNNERKDGYDANPALLGVISPDSGEVFVDSGSQWINKDPSAYGQVRSIEYDIVDLWGTGAPTSGGSGTGVNVAGPGSTYINKSNGVKYFNSNTAASPTWQTIGSAGAVSSSADGSGVPLSASVTAALSVCADTGSAALAASNTRAARFRYLIGTTPGTGDISMYGAESLLKVIASSNTTGNWGGILGHLESQGTLTITGSVNTVRAGVASFLDLASGATVAGSTIVSAFGVNPANFGTTMTGRATIIHVTNPMASTWNSFLELSSATGCTQDTAAGASGHKYLKVYINGTLYTIDCVSA